MINPISFAKLSFCDKCMTLVNKVETDHPNGVSRGPWTIKVTCHRESVVSELSEAEVEAFLSGVVAPVPLMFFSGPPRPASNTEIKHFKLLHLYTPLVLGGHAMGINFGSMLYDCSVCGGSFPSKYDSSPCPGRRKSLTEPPKALDHKV